MALRGVTVPSCGDSIASDVIGLGVPSEARLILDAADILSLDLLRKSAGLDRSSFSGILTLLILRRGLGLGAVVEPSLLNASSSGMLSENKGCLKTVARGVVGLLSLL